MKNAIKLFCFAFLNFTIMTGCSLYDDTDPEVIECPWTETPIESEPWTPAEPQPEEPEIGH